VARRRLRGLNSLAIEIETIAGQNPAQGLRAQCLARMILESLRRSHRLNLQSPQQKHLPRCLFPPRSRVRLLACTVRASFRIALQRGPFRVFCPSAASSALPRQRRLAFRVPQCRDAEMPLCLGQRRVAYAPHALMVGHEAPISLAAAPDAVRVRSPPEPGAGRQQPGTSLQRLPLAMPGHLSCSYPHPRHWETAFCHIRGARSTAKSLSFHVFGLGMPSADSKRSSLEKGAGGRGAADIVSTLCSRAKNELIIQMNESE
jgi:hypothetical protein